MSEDAREAQPAGDLPPGIGKPATRALLGAGLRTLDEVARVPEAQLLSLHGVGPKAVRILVEALERRSGRSGPGPGPSPA